MYPEVSLALTACFDGNPIFWFRSTIPFVFEVPTTLDALHDVIATHAKTGEDASLIIRRIHTANSVKLDRRNAEKMQNFYDVLLRRLVAVGDAIHQSGDGGPELGRFRQLDSLTKVLYLMAQDSADSAAAVWGRRLGFFQSAHAKRLRDAEMEGDGTDDAATAWPSAGVFLALRALGHIFPVTDQRHHVVTPALLLLGQIVSHTPVASMNDLVMGILCSGLLIEYNREAKRVVPEALAFLGGVIRLFARDGGDREPTLFAHAPLGAAASEGPFASIRDEVVSFAAKGSKEIPKLSLHKESIERVDSCATAALAAALDLVAAHANALLPVPSRECLADIENALLALQPRHRDRPLPRILWGKLSAAVSAVEAHEKAAATRKPLARRAATSVVSIKSLAPRLLEGAEGAAGTGKKRGRGGESAEATALRRELSRESKAAKRELQSDAALVEHARRSEQSQRDESAAAKRHRAYAWLEQQQGELNQQVRQGGGLLKGGGVGAARSKARTGKLGMKKGGKL
jgi:nucleolar protein 14